MARYDMSLAESGEMATGAAADILFELGLIYSVGKDVELDLAEAHKWFNLAAMRGHEKAREYRTELAAEMDTAQLRDALSRARKWMGMH